LPTIFFSWQADTPTTSGRNLVERALERAVGRIGEDTAIDEAIRDELAIDKDTKGVPGSPPIVQTIFSKIDKAAVFVPDLTFVGSRNDGRPTPNPNVLIEYGWALKSLGNERIVPVMNTAFGAPTAETMPFDMRHLRHPIQYFCPDNADDAIRRQAREGLTKQLEGAIRAVLKSETFKATLPQPLKPEPFRRGAPQDGRGRFRAAGEALGISDSTPLRSAHQIKLSKGAVIWFRVMPSIEPKKTFLVTQLIKAATQPCLNPIGLYRWETLGLIRHDDGFGIYTPLPDAPNETCAIVFFFKSGEVWSVDSFYLNGRGAAQLIPRMETDFKRALREYSDFLTKINIEPPFQWIAGMEDLKGCRLDDPIDEKTAFQGPAGPCIADVVIAEGSHSPGDPLGKSLRPFFEKLYDSCGRELPKSFDD
jgi:hypothetical protein